MMLLAILGIGLLTLSGITLRASSQGDAMSRARSNARLALILAINELQKSAGPDQRITARSDILGADLLRPRLTGVWKSRNSIVTPPTIADYTPASKKGQFLNWLVSSASPRDTTSQDFANSLASNPIRLWGRGTLGSDAPEADLIDAGKVLVIGAGTRKGALAWAVSDEGIKARINTPYDKSATTDGAKTAQLGSGERAGVEFMSGLNALSREKFEVSTPTYALMKKGVTSLEARLAADSIAVFSFSSRSSVLLKDVNWEAEVCAESSAVFAPLSSSCALLPPLPRAGEGWGEGVAVLTTRSGQGKLL